VDLSIGDTVNVRGTFNARLNEMIIVDAVKITKQGR
jgi:hypothetical protein